MTESPIELVDGVLRINLTAFGVREVPGGYERDGRFMTPGQLREWIEKSVLSAHENILIQSGAYCRLPNGGGK